MYATVGLYNTLAEAIHARDVAILAVHGYDAEIAVTLAPNSSYTQEEVVAVRMQVHWFFCSLLKLVPTDVFCFTITSHDGSEHINCQVVGGHMAA